MRARINRLRRRLAAWIYPASPAWRIGTRDRVIAALYGAACEVDRVDGVVVGVQRPGGWDFVLAVKGDAAGLVGALAQFGQRSQAMLG